MVKFMKINGKSLCGPALLLAGTVLLALPGCGREAGPSGVQKRPDPAQAAAAAGKVSGGGDEVEARSDAGSETDNTAERGGEGHVGVQQAEQGVALTKTTASELLSAIRASGKKATLVNAWASWCGPCRREVPMLQALALNLKPQGVDVVLVTVDDSKDEPKARAFLKDNGITLKSYIVDGAVADFKAGINPRWPGMLPASFLFTSSGELVHFWAGEAFENEIVPVVENFLAGRAIEPETRYGLAPGKVEP
jgi:thiol-disulfide isomerase/thioredoxin